MKSSFVSFRTCYAKSSGVSEVLSASSARAVMATCVLGTLTSVSSFLIAGILFHGMIGHGLFIMA